MNHQHASEAGAPSPSDDPKKFAGVITGTAFIAIVAFGASVLLGIPLLASIKGSALDIALGVIATAPLAVFLLWFMRTQITAFASFRESQIAFFSSIGFEFTWPRILLMAIAAGVCEELLFRGVLQTFADRYTPTIIAVVLTNVLFGLLHWRTALYALIAGVVGAYLGILFWITENLAAPIVAHALYDLMALYLTREAVREYRLRNN